jgi:hypothetical protein
MSEAVVITKPFRYDDLAQYDRVVVEQATREIRDELEVLRGTARKIGERLLAVKARLGHGLFGRWLQQEFAWSEDTAANWMNVARMAEQNPNYSEFKDRFARTASTALAAPSTPAAARDEAIERAASGEQISSKTAKEIIQKHKYPDQPPVANWAGWQRRAEALGGSLTYSSSNGSFTFCSSPNVSFSADTWYSIQKDIERTEAYRNPPAAPVQQRAPWPDDWEAWEVKAKAKNMYLSMTLLDPNHYEYRAIALGSQLRRYQAPATSQGWADLCAWLTEAEASPAPAGLVVRQLPCPEGEELVRYTRSVLNTVLDLIEPGTLAFLDFLLDNIVDELREAIAQKVAADPHAVRRALVEYMDEALAIDPPGTNTAVLSQQEGSALKPLAEWLSVWDDLDASVHAAVVTDRLDVALDALDASAASAKSDILDLFDKVLEPIERRISARTPWACDGFILDEIRYWPDGYDRILGDAYEPLLARIAAANDASDALEA